MTLTPLDIENTRFRSALAGYNRGEVDTLLARVSQELETRLTQIEELQRRISQLEQTVATYRESEELLKNSVVLAQRTSDEIIAAAHQRADAILREAEDSGRDTARRLGELKSEREQFEYAFHGLLAGFLKRLEQGNPALTADRQPAEIEARRAPPAGEHSAEPPSHSHQLLSEAGMTGDAHGEPDTAPRIPKIPVPNVPGIPTPGDRPGPPAPDDFEQAIEEARPAPRQQWPTVKPAEPAESTAAQGEQPEPDLASAEAKPAAGDEDEPRDDGADSGTVDESEPEDGRLPLDQA